MLVAARVMVLIVSGHGVWSWPGVVVTLLGFAYVFKAALYLVQPAHGLRMIGRVSGQDRCAPLGSRSSAWASW